MAGETYRTFQQIFPGKLRFWTSHCIINALPSYMIAVVWLGLWGSLPAQLGMLAAVCTFILGYSILSTLISHLWKSQTLFSAALKVGLTIRAIISGLTLFALPIGAPLILSPDVWCGLSASSLVSWAFDLIGLPSRIGVGGMTGIDPSTGDGTVDFLEIYATTLVQGTILSFMLFTFSFLAIFLLRMRARQNSPLKRDPANG